MTRSRQMFIGLRRRRRRTALAVKRFTVNNDIPGLIRVYNFLFFMITAFSGFWIMAVIYIQLLDKKRVAITVFPSGLNDIAALIPLALAAFCGLLFSAQQSVTPGSKRHQAFGKAGRRMLGAFYFIGCSFVTAAGSRLFGPHDFDQFKLSWLFSEMVKITPAFTFLSAAVACFFLISGAWYYHRAIYSLE